MLNQFERLFLIFLRTLNNFPGFSSKKRVIYSKISSTYTFSSALQVAFQVAPQDYKGQFVFRSRLATAI